MPAARCRKLYFKTSEFPEIVPGDTPLELSMGTARCTEVKVSNHETKHSLSHEAAEFQIPLTNTSGRDLAKDNTATRISMCGRRFFWGDDLRTSRVFCGDATGTGFDPPLHRGGADVELWFVNSPDGRTH